MTDSTITVIEEDVPGRRRFLQTVLGVGVLASLASFLYPVIRYLAPPRTAEQSPDSVLAAKVGDLRPNTGKVFRFGSRPALLILTADGKYDAVTAVCTHLGCTVQYRPDLRLIWCPCHNGKYTPTGQNVSGPPPRPLEQFTVAINGDEIYVSRGNA